MLQTREQTFLTVSAAGNVTVKAKTASINSHVLFLKVDDSPAPPRPLVQQRVVTLTPPAAAATPALLTPQKLEVFNVSTCSVEQLTNSKCVALHVTKSGKSFFPRLCDFYPSFGGTYHSHRSRVRQRREGQQRNEKVLRDILFLLFVHVKTHYGALL